MPKPSYSVIVPKELYPKPSNREMTAAYILIDFFNSDIKFVIRSDNKTPDFLISKVKWELKTPIGSGKYNIQHTLRSALLQSENIIIDARFSKQHIIKIKNELRRQYFISKRIKRFFQLHYHI